MSFVSAYQGVVLDHGIILELPQKWCDIRRHIYTRHFAAGIPLSLVELNLVPVDFGGGGKRPMLAPFINRFAIFYPKTPQMNLNFRAANQGSR